MAMSSNWSLSSSFQTLTPSKPKDKPLRLRRGIGQKAIAMSLSRETAASGLQVEEGNGGLPKVSLSSIHGRQHEPNSVSGSIEPATSIGNAGNNMQDSFSGNTDILDGLGFPPGFPLTYTNPPPLSRSSQDVFGSTPYNSQPNTIPSTNSPHMPELYGGSCDQFQNTNTREDLAGVQLGAPHPLSALGLEVDTGRSSDSTNLPLSIPPLATRQPDQAPQGLSYPDFTSNVQNHENQHVANTISPAILPEIFTSDHQKQILFNAQNSFNRYSGNGYPSSQDQIGLISENHTLTNPHNNQKVGGELQENPGLGDAIYVSEPHNNIFSQLRNTDTIITNSQVGNMFNSGNAPVPDDGKICKCKKDSCLQRYCGCFKSGGYCGPRCLCTDCKNNTDYEDKVKAAREKVEKLNIKSKKGCNCKTSRCEKKYCECNQVSSRCSSSCRCQDCQNPYGREEG